MSKFVGFVVGAALIAIGVFTGNVGLIVQGGAMIVTQAVVDLTMPKTPARMASEMTLQLGEQPRSALFGETFTAGSLVDGFNYGGKYGTDWECLIIRLADHKCEGLTGFYVNDEYILYTGNGNYPHFDSDHFELYFREDTSAEALTSVVTTNGPDWTSADIGRSGCDVVVCYKADAPDAKKPAWPGGRPRFGFVVKGKLCYDPRKDSTVTGGSGSHRWDDPTTWEWSENPIVCRYNWARGIYAEDDVSDPTALLIGRGLTAEEAPPENVIAPANLCDEGLTGPSPYVQRETDGLGPGAGMAISTTGAWLVRHLDYALQWWNLPTKTLLGQTNSIDVMSGTVANSDLANDGTAYFFGQYSVGLSVYSALYAIPPLGNVVRTDSAGAWFSGPTRVFDLADGSRKILTGTDPSFGTGHIDDGVPVAHAGCARDFCLRGDGGIDALYEPVGSSNQFTIHDITGTGSDLVVTGMVTRSNADGNAAICHVSAEKHYFVVTDDEFYLIHDRTTGTPGTIKSSGTFIAGTPAGFQAQTLNLPRKAPSQASFWSGFSLVSLADGSIIESVDPLDWVNEDSQSPVLYDPAGNALVSHPQFLTHANWRILGNGIRFRIAGPVYANQDFIDVEQMFAAAVAGNVITVEGSVELEPAQAKSIAFSFTDDDLLLGTEVNWNHGFLSQANEEWVNTVVARYVEPTQQWNDHAAPPARVDADIIADGRPREASIPLRLVRDVGQAQRIAEIARRIGRLWGRASVTLGPRFCEVEAGDWCEWQSDRYLGGATMTFRVEAYQIDEKWRIKMTLREMAASVFADDVSYTLDQSNVGMTPPPPAIGAPDSGGWTVTPVTLGSPAGSVPAISVSGASTDDPAVEKVIVAYWLDDGVLDPVGDPDSIPWIVEGTYPPGSVNADLTGLVGAGTYYVAIAYVVSGVTGDWQVFGPETIADLDIVLPYASAGDVQAGTAADKVVSPLDLAASAAFQTLADAATTDWDMALGYNAKWTLGGNRTLATPTNPTEGLPYSLLVIQDGTGSRTVTWPASFDWGSAGTPVLSTGAGKKDLVTLQCLDAAAPLFRAALNKAS
jgi:hypothetical protein